MGQVVSLSSLMGTRYIINSLTQRFTNCMEQALANHDTVDVGGCRFGPDCAAIMYKYYKTLDFCNSEDEYLDAVLKNNCEAARQQPEEYEELDLTKADSLDVFIDLVGKLEQGAKLCPKVNLADLKSKAILIMLIMARPDIEFDIRSCAADIFSFVRDMWLFNAQHHEEYQELVAPNIITNKVNKNGLYGNNGYGFLKEKDYIRTRQVLPIEFGNSQIIILDENQSVSSEWADVVEKCVNLFDVEEKKERIPGKTVKDFLTFREDG